jgi:hypothetical protein
LDSESDDRREPFFSLSPHESAQIVRWLRIFGWAFLATLLALVPLVRGGFFREQYRQKQALALIERRGYAYCAIWGDGWKEDADSYQFVSPSSPLHPRWQGERRRDGTYLLTFRYQRDGTNYEHRWEVDLQDQRVTVLSDNTSYPLSSDSGDRKCSED